MDVPWGGIHKLRKMKEGRGFYCEPRIFTGFCMILRRKLRHVIYELPSNK